jgi:hypothetical protein
MNGTNNSVVLEEGVGVAARVREAVAGAVGNLERLPLALPAPRLQSGDGGVQVGHHNHRQATWGGPVVGQQHERPVAEAEGGAKP